LPLTTEPVGDGFSIRKEDPRVFQGIYLGCRMEPSAEAEIVALARAHIPHVSIFRAKKSARRFGLEFEPV